MRFFYKVLCLVGICVVFITSKVSSDIVINELVTSNGAVLGDYWEDYSELIELYNDGGQPVNLEGYGLTNDPDKPQKWTFPSVAISPGERLVVMASGKDRAKAAHHDTAYLHTNFRLSATGDFVAMSNEDGQIRDSVSTGFVFRDMSYGRETDGGAEWHYFPDPSIGSSNSGTSYPERTKGFVDIGPESGKYSQSVEISLDADKDKAIYYTLDGSEPDLNSRVYGSPINVDSTVSVRARLIEDDKKPGEITSATFFIDEEFEIPIFNIITDPDNLWDDDIGLYVNGNYLNRGGEWERFSHLEYFDEEGNKQFNHPIGLRIHGGFTRQILPVKSLRIYSRGGYASFGSGTLDYKLFEHREAEEFKRFILRQSGNDWNSTMLRSAFVQTLFRPMDVLFREYEPSAIYLNGEYWGIQNIRDRDDKYFVERETGIDAEDVYMVSNRRSVDYGPESLWYWWMDFRDTVEQLDMAQPQNYDYFKTEVDVENMATYFSNQIYMNNTDWPGNNNIKYRAAGDTAKWRWIFKDFDFGFNLWSGPDAYRDDMLSWATDPNGSHWSNREDWSTLLLRNLLDNEDFKNMFINRFADHMNSWFHPERVTSKLDDASERIADEIPKHAERWDYEPGQFHDIRSMSEWYDNLQGMYDFANERPHYQKQHIKAYFGISDVHQLTLDIKTNNDSIEMEEGVKGGEIEVNENITLNEEIFYPGDELFPWEGDYFDGVPVKLEARANEGYVFSHWDGDINSTDRVIEIQPAGDENYTAVFEQTPDNIRPEPFTMADGDYLFYRWDADNSAGNYPSNMVFEETNEENPALEQEFNGFWSLGYDKEDGSRISGLGEDGVSFTRASETPEDGGYPVSAILALDTRGSDSVNVFWEAGTVAPNDREFAIRLQYRKGYAGDFNDLYENGTPVEYKAQGSDHEQVVGTFMLPEKLWDQNYIQLRWRYYPLDQDAEGKGAELKIDEIQVTTPQEDQSIPQITLNHPEAEDTLKNRYPLFEWDEAPEANYYRLEIAFDEHFEDIQKVVTSENQSRLDEALPFDTTVYWRVKGMNANQSGPWSEERSFTVRKLEKPDVVNLIAPEDNAEDVFPEVTFEWEAVADTPATYMLEVSTDPDFEEGVLNFEVSDETTKQVGPLSGETEYFWRVRAENQEGIGSWSEVQSFATHTRSAPGEVALLLPSDGNVFDDREVELAWEQSDLAQSYNVQVATDIEFDLNLREITTDENFTTLDDLDQSESYYWRVQGENPFGKGPFSEARKFYFASTSIGEFAEAESEMTVYPNPANDELRITFSGMEVSSEIGIHLTDLNGNEVEEIDLDLVEYNNEGEIRYDVGGFENGVYLIRAIAEEEVFNEKVIIRSDR